MPSIPAFYFPHGKVLFLYVFFLEYLGGPGQQLEAFLLAQLRVGTGSANRGENQALRNEKYWTLKFP